MKFFKNDLAAVSLFLAVLLFTPRLLPNEYYVSVLILAMLHALIAVGLNLLMGYAGQISLGHAGFYGLGAYTSAILTTKYGYAIWEGMIAGIVFVAIVAYIIGIPTLKLRGHYLAMGTLGFGIILSIVFNEWIDMTDGPNGMVGIERLTLFGYSFDSDESYYYLVAVVLSLIIYISYNLINSRIGRALRALHTSEKAAMAVGIDIAKYKLFIFTLSAVFAAIAGVLYTHYLTFIAPSTFGFMFSIELVAMVVLGGMGSVWGAVIGAFFLTILPELLRVFENIEIVLFGGIMVVCMIFMPRGIAGAITGGFRLLTKGKKETNHG